MYFGDFIREKRLAKGLGLREFCELAELDPSNWSKIERDKLPVPDDREKLEKIAGIIGLKHGTSEWHQFFDLAYISQKKIPDEVYADTDVISALPVFFRTVRGEKPNRKELDKIIELLKKR